MAASAAAATAAAAAAKFASSTAAEIPGIKSSHLYLTKRKAKATMLPPLKAAPSEEVAHEPGTSESSSRAQLELLEQLTSTTPAGGYESDGSSDTKTIREQLSEMFGDRDGEFTIPLGKRLRASMMSLTVSQRRNIKRQAYLDEVSQRNDSAFFATVGAFVIIPPLVILAIAVGSGYVQLLP